MITPKTFFLFFFFLSFFSSLPLTEAIGISPPRIDIAFEPNAHKEYIITLINSAPRPLNATLNLGGDLAQYMKTEEGYFVIPPQQSKAYTILIDFPAVIRRPGENIVTVNAVQAPMATPEGIKGISATLSVEGSIVVRVPYTGKYAEATLHLEAINEGEQSKATFMVINYGMDEIKNAYGTLEIYDLAGTLLDTLTTPSVYIPAQKTEETLLVLDSKNYGAGIFPVTAYVMYDGDKTNEIEQQLRIGTLFVNVTDYTKEVYTKSLAPFQITAHNRWNNPVEHLFADIRFLKQGVQIGDTLKTHSITLPPWEQLPLSAVWDTTSVAPGIYDAEITLYYHGKTTVIVVPVTVQKKFELNMTLLLSSVIILMLLIDLIVWIIHRFRNHEKDD